MPRAKLHAPEIWPTSTDAAQKVAFLLSLPLVGKQGAALSIVLALFTGFPINRLDLTYIIVIHLFASSKEHGEVTSAGAYRAARGCSGMLGDKPQPRQLGAFQNNALCASGSIYTELCSELQQSIGSG